MQLKVGYTALASRAAVILLSVISNAVLPDHAPAEEVFSWTESPTLVSDLRSLQSANKFSWFNLKLTSINEVRKNFGFFYERNCSDRTRPDLSTAW